MKAAPRITLSRHDGAPLTLPDPAGRQAWLLYFMRTSDCPPCISHVQRIDRELDVLRALGLEPLIVVPEGQPAAATLRARFGLRVAVAGSPLDDVHALFGLQKKLFGIAQQSGTVLVGGDGQIHLERVATIPLNSYRHEEVLEVARGMVLRHQLAST